MTNSNTDHLHWRAAIKSYDPDKKLTPDQEGALIEAARLAPTSYGLQPFQLYVVSNQDMKEKLKAAGYNQPAFADASHIFVLAASTTVTEDDVHAYTQRIVDQRQVTEDSISDYKGIMLGSVGSKSDAELHAWAARQVYIALGMMMDVAAHNQIDTTPMEGFDPDAFDDILSIDKNFHSVVALAAGFRSKDDKYSQMPKVRKSVDDFAVVID